MEYPEFIARFYDTIYETIRTGEDHAYYMQKIMESNGPVLEIGVGTGRFFIEALKSGADIYGVDISKEMVNVLKQKLDSTDHGRVFIQNAIDLDIPKTFDLIIAPFRMFSHLLEVQDQIRFLERVADHLAPKGTFIMDVFVPDLKLIQEGLNNFKDFEGTDKQGFKVQRFTSMKSNIIDQVSTIKMTIYWGKEKVENKDTWEFQMRYFFRYELEHLIERSPLQLREFNGTFYETGLHPDSKEFLVICTKPF